MDPLLRDIRLDPGRIPDPDAFPFTLPAVDALREPLAFLEAPERFLRQLFA